MLPDKIVSEGNMCSFKKKLANFLGDTLFNYVQQALGKLIVCFCADTPISKPGPNVGPVSGKSFLRGFPNLSIFIPHST